MSSIDPSTNGARAAETRARAGRSARIPLAVLAYLVMAVLVAVFIVPFAWMIGSSLRTQAETFRYVYPLSLHTFIPVHATLENFRSIFVDKGFGIFIWNSFWTSAVMIVLSWYVNSAAAYVFSRASFKGKEVIYLLALGTMLIPLEATVVPSYQIVRSLHLVDNLWALVIPFIAEPFGIFLLRQHIDEIPRDLDDAARIDGASFFDVYRFVVMPNIIPGQVTLALMKFLWAWSAFFWPLVVLNSKHKLVLPVAIATLFTPSQTYWGQIFAAASLGVIPMAILFMSLQRYYIRGIVQTGLK